MAPRAVRLGDGVREDDLLVHDAHAADPTLAYALSRMRHPAFPEPFGILRAVERPVYETQIAVQLASAREAAHEPTLDKLFASGDTWEVA